MLYFIHNIFISKSGGNTKNKLADPKISNTFRTLLLSKDKKQNKRFSNTITYTVFHHYLFLALDLCLKQRQKLEATKSSHSHSRSTKQLQPAA